MKSAAVRRIAAWLGGVAAVAIGVTLATGSAWAQTIGDYRSVATGNWSDATTWERWDGSSWVTPAPAAPTSADNVIEIQSGHIVTITATVTYDQVVVDAGGQVTVAAAVTHTLANGAGTDLVINGTWLNQGGTWTVTGATWSVGAGGTFIQNTASDISTPLDAATLDAASSFIYRGSSTLTPASSVSGRTYGNLTFESTSGSWTASESGAGSLTVNGDFTIGSGVTYSTAQTGVMTFTGNFTNNGTLSNSTGTQVYTFTGSSKSIGGTSGSSFFETFDVNAGASITVNAPVTIAATFTGSVAGTLIAAASVTTSGTLNVSGTLRRDTGGSFAGTAPVYAGTGSLVYNHTGSGTVGNEWTSSGAVGAGVPASVTMQGAGTLNFPGGMRGTPGNITQTAGTINLNSVTLEVGGNLSALPAFSAGSANVRFNTGSAATLSCSPGGVNCGSIIFDKGAGSLAMTCDLTAVSGVTVSTGTVSVGAHTLGGGAVVVSPGATIQVTTGSNLSTATFQCDGTYTGGSSTNFLYIGGPGTWSTTNPSQSFGGVSVGTGVTLASTVTVYEIQVLSLGSLNLSGFNLTSQSDVNVRVSSTLTVPAGSTLFVGRFLHLDPSSVYNSGGALRFTGASCDWSNSIGTQNYGDVVVASGASVTLSSTVRATSLSVSGTLDLSGFAGFSAIVSGNTDLNAGGTIFCNGFSAASQLTTGSLRAFGGVVTGSPTGVVRLTGASGHLGGASVLSLGNLEVGTGASITLDGDVNVTNSLALNGGVVTTGSSTLAMIYPAAVSRTSGGVAGNFRKHFVGGPTPSVTYEMAVGSGYEPIVVTPANVTTAGEVTVSLSGSLQSQIAASGLASGRRWGHTVSFSPGALVVSGTTRFDFTLDPAVLEGGATPSQFVARAYNGGAWSPSTRLLASPTAHSAELTLGAGTTDLALGNQGIDHYIVTASSPQTAGTPFATSVTAQDALNLTVADDNTTAVTMSSNGAAAFDANADATYGDNVKTLTNGAFNIDTRDNTAQTVTLTATDGNSKTGSRAGLVVQAGPARQLAVVQEPATSTAGVVIAPHFKVRLRDAFGNDVTTSGVSVSVALSSGSGTLLGTTTRNTDANGSVAFDDLSIQAAGTNKQLTASTGSLGPVSSANFTISAAAAANLAFDVQPSNAVAGAAIAPAVRVKVTDAFTNPIATELVSLSLVGSGTLSGYAPTNTDANGIATFSTLSVDLAGSKQLSASKGSLGPVSSASFTISAGAPANLAFDVQPSSAVAGMAIAPAVRVKVTDAFANPVATELVSLSLVGSGTLSGYAPTSTDASGIAMFSTLSVNLVGTKHLGASAGSLGPVSSANFTISAGAAASLTFDVQPSNTPVGANIAPAVRVKVTDASSNPVPTELVSLSLVGAGILSGYTPTNTDANGMAMFSTLNINLAGTKRLSASTTSLGPVLSDPFDITCPTISLAPASLTSGTAGTPYSRTVSASGGVTPYGYAVTAGALPGGLGLNGGTGEISGTPGAAGTFNFTVTATDAAGCTGARAYTLVISVACPAIAVLPATLPNGSTAVAYSQTLTASAGTAPFTFAPTTGAIPTGLSLTGAGILSGTPTAAGTFVFTIRVTDANGCTGSRGYSVQIFAIPVAVTNLSAQQVVSGNDTDGTTKILIAFTPPSGTASVEVYRAGYGHYPEYDDAGGGVPATPSYPPGAPWTLTAITASGQADETTTRDFYYYVMFVKNAAGGVSPVSNKTTGTLNYHLGDVSNGFTLGQGNNGVGDEDISLLGANYGIGEAAITSRGVEYLDVGPTTNLFLSSRPFTDDRIDFEDFIVFASNYHVVSSPALAARMTGTGTGGPEEFRVEAPSLVQPGETITAALRLKGAGRLQGFSARLAWDATVVQPVDMTPGAFIADQNGMVLSPQPGTVDAALLGAREQGITGEGEVARLTFRVLRTGDAGIRLAQVVARDAANRTIDAGAIQQATQPAVPAVTMLLAPAPNPFRGSATLVFSLSQPGAVELAVYSVDGRRVRTLVSERREPGVYRVAWDGRDEGRNPVAPGVFYAHLSAAGKRLTKTLVYLK